jgi:hypothetical protein
MRRWAAPAVVAALALVVAGCLGGGSQRATLSATDALAQARKDGFVNPKHVRSVAWRCDGKTWDQARPDAVGADAHFVVSNYELVFDDKRVPLESDNTARIAMLVVVFPDAGMARRCANSFVYQSTHSPSDPSNPTGPHIPYKVVDSTTVEMHPHAPGSEVFPEDTGDYNTMLARGRVFGLGFSRNMPHAKIVRADLERLAAEIAG